MNQLEWEQELEAENFSNITVQTEPPNVFHPDHSHSHAKVHVVLEGEIILVVANNAITLKPGQRHTVAANVMHSVLAGPEGCKYLIADKE